MDVTVDLTTTGGLAVVVLGRDFDIPADYAYHPQVHPINASDLPSHEDDLNARFPPQTKIVLIGGELPGPIFGTLRTILTRRRLVFVQRRNAPALSAALADVLPVKPVTNGGAMAAALEVPTTPDAEGARTGPKTIAPRGAVRDLVLEADLSKGSAEEARRLMRVAQQRGIPTTVASLSQGIAIAKRKGGRTETPRSLMSPQQKALQTLDEAIAGLQLIREYVADTEAMNHSLTKKLDAFKALLKTD